MTLVVLITSTMSGLNTITQTIGLPGDHMVFGKISGAPRFIRVYTKDE